MQFSFGMELTRELHRWLHFFQGYGSTEAGGISLMISREECARIGSAGRLSENVEVKIVDHVTGKALSVGQEGELLVRGPAVMTGNHQILRCMISRCCSAAGFRFSFFLSFSSFSAQKMF